MFQLMKYSEYHTSFRSGYPRETEYTIAYFYHYPQLSVHSARHEDDS